MIETEGQKRAALSSIAYWKASVSAGQQSWLAGEQALGEIMRLHKQIDEFDKRSVSPRLSPA